MKLILYGHMKFRDDSVPLSVTFLAFCYSPVLHLWAIFLHILDNFRNAYLILFQTFISQLDDKKKLKTIYQN